MNNNLRREYIQGYRDYLSNRSWQHEFDQTKYDRSVKYTNSIAEKQYLDIRDQFIDTEKYASDMGLDKTPLNIMHEHYLNLLWGKISNGKH